MGITDWLREAYYSTEDRWYNLVDALHINGIVDAIDGVIPSLILILTLLAILILLGAYILLPSMVPQYTDMKFVVKGSDELIVQGVKVNLTADKKNLVETTDASGAVIFKNIAVGSPVLIDINSGKGTFRQEYTAENNFFKIIILEKPFIELKPIKRRVTLKTAQGLRIEEEIPVIFYCQNSAALPKPTKVVDDNDGLVEVEEPLNCGKLYMRVMSEYYEQKEYLIDSLLKEVTLNAYSVPSKNLTVQVKAGGKPVSGTTFTITVTGKSDYPAVKTTNSQATIAVIPGSYTVSVSDPTGNYGIVTQIFSVLADTTVSVDVSKTVKAKLTVNVLDNGTSGYIYGANVSIKNSAGQEINRNEDVNGTVLFALTEKGNYTVTAKKVGDIGAGYSAKSVDLNIEGDANIEIRLDLITVASAGRVRVRVIDQDNQPVQDAQIRLKYGSNDSVVELNEPKNYAVSDLNGYASFLAGKVEGKVTSYAIKYPFSGSSTPPKEILLDQLNEFTVKLSIGPTTAIVNVKDISGNLVSGEIEFFNTRGNSVGGIVSLENGVAQKQIKSGQSVYVVVRGEDEAGEAYASYTSAPVMLWPDRQAVFNITVTKNILGPSIEMGGVYNSEGAQVQTLEAGKKYYARMILKADNEYSNVLMHFRAGEENHLDNDFIEIEKVEGADVYSVARGATYDPEQGYSYDSQNLVDGPAKWINAEWRNKNFGEGVREVNVWFRVKDETPPNQKLKLFWRALFDSKRLPESNIPEEFYSDTYSATYYEGFSETCDTEFCFTSEWLYSQKDELYMNQPYALRQVLKYDYHFQIINNSQYDYMKGKKPIYMYVEIVGDEQGERRIRIEDYKIKDALGIVDSNVEVFEIRRVELNSFDKKTSIDTTMTLMGLSEGAETIRVRLQSEGVEIFSKDISFTIPTEKEMKVTVKPDFIPALSNTPIEVEVKDNKNAPLRDASVKLKIKEPGFEEIIFDEAKTDRYGKAIVNSGMHYPNTTLVIEVQKEGFAISTTELIVSDKVVEFEPAEASIELNTVTKREETKSVKIKNLTMNDFSIKGITLDAKFAGLINENALNAWLEELSGEIIAGDDTTELDLLKIRLANDITPENFIEPASIDGTILVSFEVKETGAAYDVELPLKLGISSDATVEDGCILVDNATQSKVTQQGRVSFSFVLTNACKSEDVAIGLESLKASAGGEIKGLTELSLQSLGGGTTGRTALDQTQRITFGRVSPGEKIAGTVTYVPSMDAAGSSVTIIVAIEGAYAGKKLKTNPAALNFTVDVINLKECMSISSNPGPVEFDASTTVTVDASGCPKQQIDVILCKGDSGCSGGAEGSINLSKKSFTLKENSETITVSSPSIAGAYGVTVHARAKGSGSYIYIGEVPVSFNPSEGKYFKLNKYELNLYGKGSKDAVILTNKLLLESVDVKADECAWGKQDAGFDWASGLVGAGIGAGLAYMVTGALPMSTIYGGGWISGGLIIGAGIAGLLIGGNMGYECADHYQVNPMNDFIIFLQGDTININGEEKQIPGDAGALGFSVPKIGAGWNFEDAEYSAEETVGITFSNSGLNDPKPKYGLLTINATEHVHGDPLHTKRLGGAIGGAASTPVGTGTPTGTGTATGTGGASTSPANNLTTKAKKASFILGMGEGTDNGETLQGDVDCKSDTFGKYWIGAGEDQGACEGAADNDYSQQFRMRVLSGEAVDQDAYLKKATSCYNGAVAGSTGKDAVPRIKLNWEWTNIKSDSCDYGNNDYIYCDASQFSIEVSKKLAILADFFNKNPSFQCPPDPAEKEIKEQTEIINGKPASVAGGSIGVKEISALVDPSTDNTKITVSVENKTSTSASATINMIVRGKTNSPPVTHQQTFAVGVTTVEFTAITQKYNGPYFVSAAVSGALSNNQSVTRIFTNRDTPSGCWLDPSTKMVGGKPAIFYYIDTNNIGSVVWTEKITNLEALHNALLFKAYLIKDGYGETFRKDFRDYYLKTFLQAPVTTEEKSIVENFDSGKFSFKKKYLNSSDVEAGLYEVRFNIDSNETFRILRADGTLNGNVGVELLLVKKPPIEYPFYSIPFDGVLGKENGRTGYGSVYNNENGELLFGGEASTFESASGNGIVNVKTRVPNDLASLTSFASTRGQLLSAAASGGNAEIIFSPNYATPVIGKYSLNEGTSGIFGFTVNQGGTPKATGGNMTYWTGAAKSKSFDGGNAVQVYNDTPDYQMDETSGVSQPNVTYGFKWDEASIGGTIYLKTIIYTPINEVYSIIGESGTEFWTPDSEFSGNVELSGISGMQYNSRQGGGKIRTLEEIFDLVKKEKVCVTNNGSNASFWWNPKTIATSVGSAGNSVETKEDFLGGSALK
ncbi:MAG: hypothetical protein NTZ73_01370 [Candidatus Diapherotrites archaeon]|nr:hypothetical protein [Candidatus Diapherotrites archaeon]